MAVTIAQISDTHLSDNKPFFLSNFDHTAQALRDSRPDLVINTGDVSLNGADLIDDLAVARARHQALGLNWLAIAGNHDVGDCVDVARHQPVNAERLARWHDVFGPSWWSEDVPGWCLLGVDALILGSGLAQDEAQLDFIRTAAGKLDGRALMLFIHKPLFEYAPDDAGLNSLCITPAPRAALMAALGSAQPRLVVSGHTHQYRDITVDGTRHVTAPGVSFVTPPWFHPGFGLRTVGYVEHVLEADGAFRSTLKGVSRTVIIDLEDLPEAYGDLSAMRPGRGHAA